MNFVHGIFVLLLVLACMLQPCESHGSYMLSNAYCSRGTTAGTSIMGRSAQNSGERSVTVMRNGVAVTQYVPGETLQVSISSTSGEFLFVQTGATFSGGSCGNARKQGQNSNIVMPSSGTVTVKAMFASGYTTVKITPTVTLTVDTSALTEAPTLQPTVPPTVAPSSEQPTAVPTTSAPTQEPTVDPTERPTPPPGAPTLTPTTSVPTTTPTATPTVVPTTGTPTPVPSAVPTAVPSTGTPTSAPSITTSPGGYAVEGTMTLGGLGIVDFGPNSQFIVANLIATDVGIQVDQISFTNVQAVARRLEQQVQLVRSLVGSGIIVNYIISGLVFENDATVVTQAVVAYTTSAAFVSDVQGTGGDLAALTTVSGVSLATRVASTFAHTCAFDSSFVMKWSVVGNSINAVLSMADPDGNQPWIAAGLVRRADYMVPLDGHRHSVYQYDPGLSVSGYYLIEGYTADKILRDPAVRDPQNKVNFLQGSLGSVELGFTEVPDTSPDAKYVLDVAGTNVVMWAHGGNWPIEHTPTARGFVKVDWSAGSCEVIKPPLAMSPLWIFLVLVIPVFFKQVMCRLTALRFVTDFLRYARIPYLSLLVDVSLGGILVMLLHTAICVAVATTTYYSTSYQTPSGDSEFDGKGAILAFGRVGMMNFWLALLPTARTSVWPMLTGVSYERNIKYHKGIVYLAVMGMVGHYLMNHEYPEYHDEEDGLKQYGHAIPTWGFWCFVVFVIVTAAASDPVRWIMPYETFKLTHMLSMIGVVLLVLHLQSWAVVYIGFIPGVLMHSIDGCKRVYLWATAVPAESLKVIKAGDEQYTKLVVAVPEDRVGPFIPGSFCFLCIYQAGAAEWHPISVAEHHTALGECTLTFYIKSMASEFVEEAVGLHTWSRRLATLATASNESFRAAGRNARQQPSAVEIVAPVTVAVDGPYGCLSLDIGNYDTVCIVCGGIGVTPMIPILEWIVAEKGAGNLQRVTTVEFHWSVRGAAPLYTSVFAHRLLHVSKRTSSRRVVEAGLPKGQEVVSRKGNAKQPVALGDDDEEEAGARGVEMTVVGPGPAKAYAEAAGGLCVVLRVYDTKGKPTTSTDSLVTCGRPNIEQIVAGVAVSPPEAGAVPGGGDHMGCVLVCGPAALSQRVAVCAGAYSNVHVHTETFGY